MQIVSSFFFHGPWNTSTNSDLLNMIRYFHFYLFSFFCCCCRIFLLVNITEISLIFKHYVSLAFPYCSLKRSFWFLVPWIRFVFLSELTMLVNGKCVWKIQIACDARVCARFECISCLSVFRRFSYICAIFALTQTTNPNVNAKRKMLFFCSLLTSEKFFIVFLMCFLFVSFSSYILLLSKIRHKQIAKIKQKKKKKHTRALTSRGAYSIHAFIHFGLVRLREL